MRAHKVLREAAGWASIRCAMRLRHLLRLVGFAAVAPAIVGATSAMTAGNAGPPVVVSYRGPALVLQGDVVLRAHASARGERVVAVNFLLDGVPVGSDTTPPFELDASTRMLPRGEHRLRVVAVDARGRRGTTKAIALRIRPAGRPVVEASPQRGLERAIAALRAGNVVVRLAPGNYRLAEVVLGTGARLVGSGKGTVIAPPVGAPYFALLVARGSGIRISDLTLDGGGPGGGDGIGVAIFEGSSDVRLHRLRIVRVRRDGVNAWGRHADVSVQDSLIDGGSTAFAGVRVLGSDASRDASVLRTTIRRFRGYGIVFAQKEYGRPAAALHALALDNTISDISDPAHAGCDSDPLGSGCGTTEAGIESGGVEAAIVGNTIRRTRWDGIETVGSSTRVSVVGNDVADTRVGVYVERSTIDSRVEHNRIARVRTGINVEWLHDGGASRGNRITRNEIVRARYAPIFVDVGADGHRIERNRLVGGARPGIVLQGASRNVVRLNRACGARGPIVIERSGWWQDGGEARPSGNVFAANASELRCPTATGR